MRPCHFFPHREGVLGIGHPVVFLFRFVVGVTLNVLRCITAFKIILGKLRLWNCRRNNSLPFFSSYKEVVKRKCGTERHIAAKYNNMKMLEAKWKPVLN